VRESGATPFTSSNDGDEDRDCQARLSAFMEHARSKVFDKEPLKGSLDGKVQSIAGEIKHMHKLQLAIFMQDKRHAGVETDTSAFKQAEIRKREAKENRRKTLSETFRRVGKLVTTSKFWERESEKKTRYQRDDLKTRENVEGEAQEHDSEFAKLREELAKVKEELQEAKEDAQKARTEAQTVREMYRWVCLFLGTRKPYYCPSPFRGLASLGSCEPGRVLDHIRCGLIAKRVSEETPVGFLLNQKRTNGSILGEQERTLWKEEERERQGLCRPSGLSKNSTGVSSKTRVGDASLDVPSLLPSTTFALALQE
jgi:hypothetical protein